MTLSTRPSKRSSEVSRQGGPEAPLASGRRGAGKGKKSMTAPVADPDALALLAPLSSSRNWRDAIPNDRLGHVVKELLRSLTRGLQIRLMDHSVSHGYWAFLRVLWEHDGITQRELAEMAGVTEPTTYSALRAMERLGYVTRKKLPSNLRNVCVELTPQGRALKPTLIPLAEDLNAVAVSGIPAEDLVVFRRTALAMMKNLEQDEITRNRTLPPLRRPR